MDLHRSSGYTRTFCATRISAQKPLGKNIFWPYTITNKARIAVVAEAFCDQCDSSTFTNTHQSDMLGNTVSTWRRCDHPTFKQKASSEKPVQDYPLPAMEL